MIFLSRYLEAKMDDRLVLLRACPFFRDDGVKGYVYEDEDVLDLIRRLCVESGDTPSPSYFRKTRAEFVTSLIERGEDGAVSAENAVKQAVAFAGVDWRDKCDMVTALGKWQSVADEVKKQTGAWNHPPQYYHVGKNLLKTPECRTTLHVNQTTEEVCVVDSMEALERAKLEVTADWSYVHLIHNRDPRRLTEKPSMIVFKAPQSRVYAFFPQELSEDLCRSILSFIAEAEVAGRMLKALRAYMTPRGIKPRFLDVTPALTEVGAGRTVESVADWTWGSRFCPIAREEWMTPPLTPAQQKHVAYFMELMEHAILKIGVDKIPAAK